MTNKTTENILKVCDETFVSVNNLKEQLKEADELLLKHMKQMLKLMIDDAMQNQIFTENDFKICEYLAKKGYLIKVSDRVYKVKTNE